MTLAREVVNLDASLREDGLGDPFRAGARGELSSTPAASPLIDRFAAASLGDPAAAILLAIQALRVQRADLAPRLLEAAFVATVPGDLPGGAQPTERVVFEMLRSATREVIALGYEVSDAGFLGALSDAAERGVAVTLICDRKRVMERRLEGLRVTAGALKVYVDLLEADDTTPYPKMHSKCLLVDGDDLLITSANFTYHGLQKNIEIGVRLRGGPSSDARKLFEHLEGSGYLRSIVGDELTALGCRA